MSYILNCKKNGTWYGIPSICGPQGPIGPRGPKGDPGEGTPSLPRLYIIGTIPTTKINNDCNFIYEINGETIEIDGKIKCQGTSSMSYPKKNFTITFFTDFSRETKKPVTLKEEWGAESVYCLKANWVDGTHQRNISAGNIWSNIVESRSDYDFLPAPMKAAYNHGAVDGFPIKLYANGVYQGIYTCNIPKADWMFGMDASNPNHVALCAETNSAKKSWVESACNFRKLWSGGDGNDWSIEVGTNTPALKTSVNNLISFVMNASSTEFTKYINEYLDLQSAIDYYIFVYFICAMDNLAKNMVMITYDLKKWYLSPYDLDSTFGNYYNGAKLVEYNFRCPEDYEEPYSNLFRRLWDLYPIEFNNRYNELRNSVFKFDKVFPSFESFANLIGEKLYAQDKKIYTTMPDSTEGNYEYQMEKYLAERALYCDTQFNRIQRIPCSRIDGNTAITFEDINIPFEYSYTVVPSNSTDKVVFELDPNNVIDESTQSYVCEIKDNSTIVPKNIGETKLYILCGDTKKEISITVAAPSPPPIEPVKVQTFETEDNNGWTQMYSNDYFEMPEGSSIFRLYNVDTLTCDIFFYNSNKEGIGFIELPYEHSEEDIYSPEYLQIPSQYINQTKYIRVHFHRKRDTAAMPLTIVALANSCDISNKLFRRGNIEDGNFIPDTEALYDTYISDVIYYDNSLANFVAEFNQNYVNYSLKVHYYESYTSDEDFSYIGVTEDGSFTLPVQQSGSTVMSFDPNMSIDSYAAYIRLELQGLDSVTSIDVNTIFKTIANFQYG